VVLTWQKKASPGQAGPLVWTYAGLFSRGLGDRWALRSTAELVLASKVRVSRRLAATSITDTGKLLIDLAGAGRRRFQPRCGQWPSWWPTPQQLRGGPPGRAAYP
jgi:hypothetical protein